MSVRRKIDIRSNHFPRAFSCKGVKLMLENLISVQLIFLPEFAHEEQHSRQKVTNAC